MDSVRIPLGGRKYPGLHAIVDKEDYENLSRFRWYAFKMGVSGHSIYAARGSRKDEGDYHIIFMHRDLMNAKPGEQVDHADMNTLNNSRSNLRIATQSQNRANQRLDPRNTSGYKGVAWKEDRGKWRARIKVDRREIHLGYFTDLVSAAKAYDTAAIAHFGEFARVNFPK